MRIALVVFDAGAIVQRHASTRIEFERGGVVAVRDVAPMDRGEPYSPLNHACEICGEKR